MKYLLTVFVVLAFISSSPAQAWSEDFEGAWPPPGWSVSNGTWGLEDSGYQSDQSAGTVPGGDYFDNVESSLISPSFQVPSASQNPRLRFWHWFSFSAGDYGEVWVRPNGGIWELISPQYVNRSSGTWSSPSLDLGDYAGQVIEISFFFRSINVNGGPPDVSYGWYIDDVTILPDICPCPAIYDPVCGANGVTYPNACEAECAGIFAYTPGPCGQSGAPALIIADSICAAAGQIVEVPVTVQNFTDITSFNISLAIGDPAVAVFDALAAGSGLPPLFGSNVINNGNTAIVSWFSTSGAPVSLPDGAVLFTINVLLGDAEGSCTDISFTNTPTPVAVFKEQAGQSVAVTPTLVNGSVCIKSDVAVCGRICRENGDGLVNVSLSMTDGQDSWNTGSNPAGSYCLEAVPAGGDYTITPEKNAGWRNGVLANDLFLIQRHILQIESLDSPYKMISADADASGSIDGNDLFQLQRLILLQIPAINGNTSWRFVPKAYQFPGPSTPFVPPFPETLSYNNLSTNITDADFLACKIGDVDLSAVNMGLAPRALALPNTLDLCIERPELKAGSSVVIPVSASNFQNIAAYQFTLEFDAEKLSLEEIISGSLPGWSASNFGLDRANEGLLTTLWYNPIGKGAALNREQELFSLRFKVLDAGQNLEELIRVSSQLTPALGFLEDGSPIGIHLGFRKPLRPANSLISHTVIPNPFTTDATLVITVNTEQQGQIVIFDQFGKVLKTYEGTFAAGRNEVPLGLGKLSATGVLFYEIRLQAGNAAGRMIRVRK